VANHHRIRIVKPKLLVANFANPTLGTHRAENLVHKIIAGFAEGSRYHGYVTKSKATPQFQYQVAKFVNLRDGDPGFSAPPSGWPYDNSRQYPRKSSGAWTFDYAALFNSTYAKWFGIKDKAGHHLGLCDMVNKGIINELWIVGSGDRPDANAAEVLENKQRYNPNGSRIPGSFDSCAGNGCFDADIPQCGRSFRIGWVNYNRGPGCYMHSHGHGFEHAAVNTVVPQWSKWFIPFAGFNLDRPPYNLPFQNLYAECPFDFPATCLGHTTPTTAVFHYGGQLLTKNHIDFVCGNVHFPPNARSHYDYATTDVSVLTSCDSFGHAGGAKSIVNATIWAGYEQIYDDCGGGFLTWWYQNMPWHGSGSKNSDGSRMLSPGPFLFY